MEKNTKEKSGVVCVCDNCQTPGYHSFHRFFLLRWLLGILILAMVFGVGFKLGEFKGMFDPETTWGMHDGTRFNHMYYQYQTQSPLPSQTSTSTK
ncbi:MAG: hypothetical protein KW788_03120 [Candidatus Doudnabacteria bacterium]|nr:hypothetical protein [Candidatus Doudnabacteria bacterium]